MPSKLVITSSTKWGVAAQQLLFVLPYATIAWTGLWLLQGVRNGASYHITRTVLGCIELAMLVLYWMGFQFMGNHYLKIYSWLASFIGIIAMLVTGDFRGAAITFGLFWIPAIATLRILITVPSISEIVPAKLYLGNRKAPTCRDPPVLEMHGITHVLELTDGGSTQNDRSRVPVEHHLQLCVTDSLGSHESFNTTLLSEGVTFMEQAIQKTNGAVLVHCAAGCSRSAAMVLYFLVKQKGIPIATAYQSIRRCRPVVDVSVDHIAALRNILDGTETAKTK